MLDPLYDSLDRLPADERRQLLRELLPPQELFARMDGTRFLVRRRGLGMFETRTLLSEAGIPDGDARQQGFTTPEPGVGVSGAVIHRALPLLWVQEQRTRWATLWEEPPGTPKSVQASCAATGSAWEGLKTGPLLFSASQTGSAGSEEGIRLTLLRGGQCNF